MKNRLWLLQIPIILLFSSAFVIHEKGINGTLGNDMLRETVFPSLRTASGWFTNLKFRIRGPRPPKNKIVIVEIDSDSLAHYGRWPWDRQKMALLVLEAFRNGAKVVGLDILFSEPNVRVSEELAEFLNSKGLGASIPDFETDPVLGKIIQGKADSIVLGWMTERACQPSFSSRSACAVTDPAEIESHPEGITKFAIAKTHFAKPFSQETTPILSTPNFIANIAPYNEAAKHSGFLNVPMDPDGYIRRINLLMMANGHAYPSLALEMAKLALGEEIEVSFDDRSRVASMGFRSGKKIPVSPLGIMDINFRGGYSSFQYIRAMELFGEEDQVRVEATRGLASTGPSDGKPPVVTVSRKEALKDALVLIGVSALGVGDLRAFPFGTQIPGVEGHANILDNLLAGDMLTSGDPETTPFVIFLMMTLGALLFALGTQKLESIPALLLFVGAFSAVGFADYSLFANNQNWNMSLFYIEAAAIFGFTLSAKYVIEERSKKFLKTAFAKYLAPAMVDVLVKDQSKLVLGGVKKDLTILFSDIRGFTTFSEKLDAKVLATFLNEYLGLMTDLVLKNHGTLDKYIGDAVMAFWGAPIDSAYHATNSCKAAIQMIQTLGQHRKRLLEKYGVDVQIGIGINSGPVTVGNLGSEQVFGYTVIGDNVNLASRLEGMTKQYGALILTTRATFDLIEQAGDPLPPHRVIDSVIAKGKKSAVELIQILHWDANPEGLALFQEARAAYRARDWDGAIQKFIKAADLLTHDGDRDMTCQIFVGRCEEFKQIPPNADWDGSWEMHSK